MRSGGPVTFGLCALHSLSAAKSYNIVGRREFCCRAIILLGEGNSVVLSYSRDAVYNIRYEYLYISIHMPEWERRGGELLFSWLQTER